MEGETRYAKSGDAHIAFQARGDGPIDIVYVPQLGTSDVESRWEPTDFDSVPGSVRDTTRGTVVQQLTRFARVIMFDKRGTGLSGRVLDLPTFEQQIDDVVAVMDARGRRRPSWLASSTVPCSLHCSRRRTRSELAGL